MDETVNISMVGVGGQGILLTSDITAKVAMAAGFDAKKSEVHGMAQRGGSVISQVRFGKKIYSPIIPDGASQILVSFEKMETLRWKHLAAPGAKVLVNMVDLVSITVSSGQQPAFEGTDAALESNFPGLVKVEAQKIALELGNARCMNMVMAGVISKYLAFEEAVWLQVMKERIPGKLLELNLKAFAAGRAV